MLYFVNSLWRNVGVKVLRNELHALWKNFIGSISYSNMKDYLSLEHLGIILKYLANKGIWSTLNVYI